MKEDALDLAKGRVYKLEKQLKDEMKKSLKESQAKEFYLTKGGQWKSKFMELSDRVGRRACKVRLLLFFLEKLKTSHGRTYTQQTIGPKQSQSG